MNGVTIALDPFTLGYAKAALASVRVPGPDGPEPLVNPSVELDFAPETLAAILKDCAAFQKSDTSGADLFKIYESDAPCSPTQAGRAFWYTRNGHGSGFRDGAWPEEFAAALTAAAKAFGEVDMYLGDDGKVYLRESA